MRAPNGSLPVCDKVFPILYCRRSEDGYGDAAAEAKLFYSAAGIDVEKIGLYKIGERIFNFERTIMIWKAEKGGMTSQ